MDLLPEFRLGILNGWIPLVIYLAGLIGSVSSYSREARIWLFKDPKTQNKGVLRLLRPFGQLAMAAYILMMIFTPLKISQPIFLVGAGIYTVGFMLVMSALYHFRKTPLYEPVVTGPYRVSRNPQWLAYSWCFWGQH